MRGRLISLEGGEGAGKSSVMKVLLEALLEAGIDVVPTREPGGTPLGEALRHLLLDARSEDGYPDLCAESELLMMFASRAQLVREVVQPALDAGRWVVADRFTDASFAYQGGGRGQPAGRIAELERWAAGIRPDLTLLLDVPVAVGMDRARGRGPSDRIETESDSFFERVRATYRDRAAADPLRFRVIDASQPLEAVIADVRQMVVDFVGSMGSMGSTGSESLIYGDADCADRDNSDDHPGKDGADEEINDSDPIDRDPIDRGATS